MILFYLLITVMPLIQHPLWSHMMGELTVIKYLGLGCLLYTLFYLGSRRSPPRFFETPQSRWFVLLALFGITSFALMGPAGTWEMSPFMSYVSFLLLFFVTLTVVDSMERVLWVILVAIGSVAIASLYVLREWQKNYGLYSEFRPGWVTGDPNYFTISALLCIPLAYYLMQDRELVWERRFCRASLIIILPAVILAASRGGFFGLVAASLFMVWRSDRRMKHMAILCALLIPLFLAVPASPVHRLLRPSYGDAESTNRRMALWTAGWHMAKNNPVIGVGLGNFKHLVRDIDSGEPLFGVAHNTYIEMGAELGLPGLVTFLAILWGSFRTLDQVRQKGLRSGQERLRKITEGMQAGFVGYAVGVVFVSAQYQKLFWLMVFLTMCLPALGTHPSSGHSISRGNAVHHG